LAGVDMFLRSFGFDNREALANINDIESLGLMIEKWWDRRRGRW